MRKLRVIATTKANLHDSNFITEFYSGVSIFENEDFDGWDARTRLNRCRKHEREGRLRLRSKAVVTS
jgi:hypothetical protein